jgi:hypothetical protein
MDFFHGFVKGGGGFILKVIAELLILVLDDLDLLDIA